MALKTKNIRNNGPPIFWVLGLILFLISSEQSISQGFLHTSGKNIADGSGNNVILRGIGTGNWMLQEGYMMKTTGIAGTQHEFRAKLVETIGAERTDEFYESWLVNHMRKVDVDSMAAWGFNSIRLAMHYKWFTLPIEEEAIQDENTWLDKGFEITDSLLSWCASNQMYLILDLHGAPGGQGKNADISDYDDTKPSLWESELNKNKTVALWEKLAERYNDSPWIGGYDLINEVNWSFPGNRNTELRELYIRITEAIRIHDRNHIIFIEGNDFANNFKDLTPPWDDNMVYSFHKYWTYNTINSLDWVKEIRDEYDIPLWLGESGENSNTWFTNLVELCENNNIGWAWWPVKKAGINNVLEVETNDGYDRLINTWKGNGSMSADAAYQAVMTWSENHRFENCRIKYDVIDALLRQPQTSDTKSFSGHNSTERIFAVDFDFGRNNHAYFDTDTMNCHFSNKNDTIWNLGWAYRNDAVDIHGCNDEEDNNGFCVGWTKEGEWLQYTILNELEAAYTMRLRTAGKGDGRIHIEVNGKAASGSSVMDATGGWYTWGDNYIGKVILPAGEIKVKIYFDTGDVNLNFFEFSDPKQVEDILFEIVSAETDQIDNKIFLNLNKEIKNAEGTILASDFQLVVNHVLTEISDIYVCESNSNQLIIEFDRDIFYPDVIKINYRGESIVGDSQQLEQFTGFEVANLVPSHHELPCRIEAEDYYRNQGFSLEKCDDFGGGQNTAHADDGDYLDYLLKIPEAGRYRIDFRIAAEYGNPEILVMHNVDDRIIPVKALKFNSTGGWQNWSTQSGTVELPAGKLLFRVYSRKGEHNLNWIEFSSLTGVDFIHVERQTKVYPNPASDSVKIEFPESRKWEVKIYSIDGKRLIDLKANSNTTVVDLRDLLPGNYIITILGGDILESSNLQVVR